MSQPEAIEALTLQIRSDLDAVHAQVMAELTAIAAALYTQPVAARVARLRALERTLTSLADEADAIAARHVAGAVQAAYEIGAWATAVTTRTTPSFAAVDIDAVTHIATDTMDSLLRATKGVREDVKVMIREVVRDKVRAKVVVGQTAQQAGRDLAAERAERGVTAITYSDGRRVTLPTYAEMVVRTKTAEAYQEGGFNQGERLGIEWWEVMDGPGCGWSSHDDPQTADGMIVTLEIARQHPTSHPNCRRATSRGRKSPPRARPAPPPPRPRATPPGTRRLPSRSRPGRSGSSPFRWDRGAGVRSARPAGGHRVRVAAAQRHAALVRRRA